MTLETILVEKRRHVAYVTMNRPDVRNALNDRMHIELHDTWRDLRYDDDVRSVILTAAGDAFCAGRDVKELDAANREGRRLPREDPQHPDHGKLGFAPPEFDKPIVGAINGFAVAGGLGMLMSCDIRVAVDTAWIGEPHARVGQFGGFARIVENLPDAIAAELFYASGRLSAAECLRFGIFNRVVPAPELMQATEAIVDRILENSPSAVRTYKRMMQLWRQRKTTPSEQHLYLLLEDVQRHSDEGREGARSFVEKRKPAWIDR